jgi:hypothetical protein
MRASAVDPELWFLHKPPGKLTMVMTKHVDDLKAAGPEDVIVRIFSGIQEVFGEMKLNWGTFVNCGIRHEQCAKTHSITLDQNHYVQSLRPIHHPQTSSGQPEDEASPDLHKLYMSLLGAVAYLSHTRADVMVFVCALQRHSAKPKVEHVRRLNRLLRWLQRHPRKLVFKACSGQDMHLRIISDAAFKRETEDGYALRGALFLRTVSSQQGVSRFSESPAVVHAIEWVCKSQKHVTRSTFAAELLSAGETVDHGLLLSHMLKELEVGPLSPSVSRGMCESGGFIPMALYVDARSVYAAITASCIRAPSDKSLLCHVLHIRELLDNKALSALVGWTHETWWLTA